MNMRNIIKHNSRLVETLKEKKANLVICDNTPVKKFLSGVLYYTKKYWEKY